MARLSKLRIVFYNELKNKTGDEYYSHLEEYVKEVFNTKQ